MNKLRPFNKNTFDKAMKFYFSLSVVGLLISPFMDDKGDSGFNFIFSTMYFILFLIVFICKKIFQQGIYEPFCLYILYFSMVISNTGYILLSIPSSDNVNYNFLWSQIFLMFGISLSVYIYMIVMRKIGKKFMSENILSYVEYIPLLLLLYPPIFIYDELPQLVLWIGSFSLVLTFMQYTRVKDYTNQKGIERYGDSINYLKNKKGLK